MLRLLLTRKWLIRHALLVLAVAAFSALAWWQIQRAGAGNARSIGYAFEWPLLAGCAVYAWVRALRHDLHPPADRPEEATADGAAASAQRLAEHLAEEPDEELDAYNRHLAWLYEQDQRQSR